MDNDKRNNSYITFFCNYNALLGYEDYLEMWISLIFTRKKNLILFTVIQFLMRIFLKHIALHFNRTYCI